MIPPNITPYQKADHAIFYIFGLVTFHVKKQVTWKFADKRAECTISVFIYTKILSKFALLFSLSVQHVFISRVHTENNTLVRHTVTTVTTNLPKTANPFLQQKFSVSSVAPRLCVFSGHHRQLICRNHN